MTKVKRMSEAKYAKLPEDERRAQSIAEDWDDFCQPERWDNVGQREYHYRLHNKINKTLPSQMPRTF